MTAAPQRPSVLGTMAGLMLTLFLAALDQTIVGTAMPRIVESLNGLERYAWVAVVYMLVATLIGPIAGRMSDIYGRRPLLLAGVILFVGASALCGSAASMTVLILFRGLQGLGGGMIMSLCFTQPGDLLPLGGRHPGHGRGGRFAVTQPGLGRGGFAERPGRRLSHRVLVRFRVGGLDLPAGPDAAQRWPLGPFRRGRGRPETPPLPSPLGGETGHGEVSQPERTRVDERLVGAA